MARLLTTSLALSVGVAAGFAPPLTALRPSRMAVSKVYMCDAPAEEAPAEASVLDSLSDSNAAMMETIKGLTLEEAAALMKEMEDTFNLGDKEDDDSGDSEE